MTELDWETVEIDTIDEEDFWDLQTSAAANEQEVALSVWRQLAISHICTGYASIEAMVADPGNRMPMKNRLKFFRRKIQVLQKQVHLLSSVIPHSKLLGMKLAAIYNIMLSSNDCKLTDHLILNVRITMEDQFTQGQPETSWGPWGPFGATIEFCCSVWLTEVRPVMNGLQEGAKYQSTFQGTSWPWESSP